MECESGFFVALELDFIMNIKRSRMIINYDL